MDRARLFGQVAERYERRRPGYPDALFDAVLTAVPGARRVLEAGAGTGRASVALAERGLEIDAVEPDAQMAAVARRAVEGLPVRLSIEAFESIEPDPGAFDLVVSAQAWHWIDPVAGAAVAVRALRPGGALALWWNRLGGGDGPVLAAIQDVYAREAPELAEHRIGGGSGLLAPDPQPGLGAWSRQTFDWSRPYTAAGYGELIGTYSDHLLLPEAQRARLVAAVEAVIEEAGGVLDYPYRTHLWIARRD